MIRRRNSALLFSTFAATVSCSSFCYFPPSLPPFLPIYPSCCLVRSSLKASSLRRRTSRSRWAERETD